MTGNEPRLNGSTAEARPPHPQDVTGSFDDPEVFQAFVRALYGCIQHKLDTAVDNGVNTEVAGLNRLLTLMPAAIVERNREFFELAF